MRIPSGLATATSEFTHSADGFDVTLPLAEGSDGYLYGVARTGLNHQDSVFRRAKDGSSFAVVHRFKADTREGIARPEPRRRPRGQPRRIQHWRGLPHRQGDSRLKIPRTGETPEIPRQRAVSVGRPRWTGFQPGHCQGGADVKGVSAPRSRARPSRALAKKDRGPNPSDHDGDGAGLVGILEVSPSLISRLAEAGETPLRFPG